MHLNAEVALNLVERRLDNEEEAFWIHHMETCDSCARDVKHWQELRIGLKSVSNEDLEKALRVVQSQSGEDRSTVRSVLAETVFDSLSQPATAGARGSASPARQIIMRADDFDIHIKVWGDENRRQMLGQVLSRKGSDFIAAARLHLLCNGEQIQSTVTDDLGEFRFSDVPQGVLSIQVDLPNLTVIGVLNFP